MYGKCTGTGRSFESGIAGALIRRSTDSIHTRRADSCQKLEFSWNFHTKVAFGTRKSGNTLALIRSNARSLIITIGNKRTVNFELSESVSNLQFEQSTPENPEEHRQLPLRQSPRFKQLFGQEAATSFCQLNCQKVTSIVNIGKLFSRKGFVVHRKRQYDSSWRCLCRGRTTLLSESVRTSLTSL
jgi:hypothetical protein